MRLFSLKAALLLFTTISLVSCKDDDEPNKNEPDNKFAIAGESYKIADGIFMKDLSANHDANETAYYRNAVIFITDGITTTTVEGETRPAGQGDFVELMLNNEGQELKAGTYTWQGEENEQPFDFWSGEVTLGWSAGVEGSGTDFNFQSGTVVVAKSGDTYTITFEGVAVGDANHDEIPDEPVTVSGTYEGTLRAGQRDF